MTTVIQTGTQLKPVFEDFRFLLDDGGVAIVDANGLQLNDLLLIAISGDVQMDVIETLGNGVASFSGAGGATDGICITSQGYIPSKNGQLVMEARFRTSLPATDFRGFFGFVETLDRDEPTIPFSLSVVTLTDNDVGNCYGAYYDSAATTKDWRAAGSAAGTIFSHSGALGIRANATPVIDHFMIGRVVIEPDGSARCYYGDESMAKQNGLTLIDSLPAGSLSKTAVYRPALFLTEVSTGDPTHAVDYFKARGSGRDWSY